MSIRHYSLMCPGGGLLFKVQYGIVFLFKGILRVFQSSILPCSFFLSAVSKLLCVLSVSIQIQTAHSQIFERSKYNICLNFLPVVLLRDAKVFAKLILKSTSSKWRNDSKAAEVRAHLSQIHSKLG